MNNLLLINEYSSNGYIPYLLDILSIIAVFTAIAVIITKNPIVSVLFLIGLFVNIAGYLILVGLHFIGLSYLLVYVGAVSILFLFILMLINVRISELLSETKNSIPLVFIIALCFNISILQLIPNNYVNKNDNILNSILNNILNGNSYVLTTATWDSNIVENNHITSIGNIMYSTHSIWLILVSVILLLAMVGAIVITIKQENNKDTLLYIKNNSDKVWKS